MSVRTAARPANDFVIRLIGKDDVSSFMSLYKLCFDDKSSEKYIRWRYFKTPVGTTPTVLAFDKDACVACYAVWPTPLLLSGKEVMGALGMDAMTHPDYRSQGLFVRLAEQCYGLLAERGYQVIYGYPGDLSYPGGTRRLNWDHVCEIPRWVRPLWFFGTSSLSGIGAATSLLWSSTAAKDFRIVPENPGPDMVAALVKRCGENKDICRLKRGPEWFAWRYHADSDRDYRWIAAYAGAELKGLAVWRFDPATRRVFLCELIGEPQSIRAVLENVLRAAYRQKARVLDFPTNDRALIPLLQSNGFVRRPGYRFVVRSLTGKTLPANIHMAEAWRLYGGDIDSF
jgi:GNAT superfamily N-acetyltransferase